MTCNDIIGFDIAAVDYRFTAKQGEDEEIQITFTDEDGVALNLAGFTFTGQVRPTALSSTVSASFTFDTTDAGTGVVIATLAGSDTALMTAGENPRDKSSTYYYDMRYTSGIISTYFLQGPLTLVRRVTR